MFEVNPELKVKIEKVPDLEWSGIDKMVFVIDDFILISFHYIIINKGFQNNDYFDNNYLIGLRLNLLIQA